MNIGIKKVGVEILNALYNVNTLRVLLLGKFYVPSDASEFRNRHVKLF